jgi:hypothetical protein
MVKVRISFDVCLGITPYPVRDDAADRELADGIKHQIKMALSDINWHALGFPVELVDWKKGRVIHQDRFNTEINKPEKLTFHDVLPYIIRAFQAIDSRVYNLEEGSDIHLTSEQHESQRDYADALAKLQGAAGQ